MMREHRLSTETGIPFGEDFLGKESLFILPSVFGLTQTQTPSMSSINPHLKSRGFSRGSRAPSQASRTNSQAPPRPGEQIPEALEGVTVRPQLTTAETPIRTNLRGSPPREAPRPSPARGQPRRRPRRWSPPGDSAASGCVPTPAELSRRRLKGASSAATRDRPGSPFTSAASQRGEVPVI